jgi:folate-binding protein YgfZ
MIDVVLDRDRLASLRSGGTIILNESAVLRMSGPGVFDCLQGVFTNDVVGHGGDFLVYGAFLTPKGMIVTDGWVMRSSGEALLILPARSADGMLALFQRSIPPRLAQAADLRARWSVAWLYGAEVERVLERAALGTVPSQPGAAATWERGAGPLFMARGTAQAPFEALLVGDTVAVEAARKHAVTVGARLGTLDDFHAARILAGWPALGNEIGARTLPQEVRFDDLKGVSHTKGCYTGQETVARLHFRGHTNKEIRGLRWHGGDPLTTQTITQDGTAVGIVHSTLRLPDRTLALAMLRRAVVAGSTVTIEDREAAVVPLPFTAADIEG